MSERMMNLPLVIAELYSACGRLGGQSQWATKHKLSPQYVSDVLKHRRKPGPSLLKALGIRKVISYEKVKS